MSKTRTLTQKVCLEASKTRTFRQKVCQKHIPLSKKSVTGCGHPARRQRSTTPRPPRGKLKENPAEGLSGKKTRFVSTRYTMHVNMEILHPHFPKYKKERLQIPKTRFAKHISAFCEFRFLHLQNQKTNIRKYVTTPFSKFENNRLQFLISGSREITEINNERAML